MFFAVIVAGTPNSADPSTECFPPALRFQVDSEGNVTDIPDEPLAPDLRTESFSRVRARLVAALLGIPFDALWRRDERRRTQQRLAAAALACGVFAAIGAGWIYVGEQQDLAKSRGLAAESQRVVGQDPVEALRLAIAASETAQTNEALKALAGALNEQRIRSILTYSSPVDEAKFSPDSKWVLSCLRDGAAVAQKIESPYTEIRFQSAGDRGPWRIPLVRLSPDGGHVLTIGESSGARLGVPKTVV